MMAGMRRLALCMLASLALVVGCGSSDDQSDALRATLEGFFAATLNGDTAALDGYISDSCEEKAAFIEQARALAPLGPVSVEVPEGALLFDVEDEIAVAKRASGGPAIHIDGESARDDRSNDSPLKLEREDGDWRVVNCDAYVPD